MVELQINTAHGSLTVHIQVTTPQVVGYELTVFGSDGNMQLEQYVSDSQTNNPFQINLPKEAKMYQECWLSLTLSILDPAGAGNPFHIDYSVRQQGADLTPTQQIAGASVAGNLKRLAIFHIK